MYCNACGKAIPDDANLCSYCGHPCGGIRPRRPFVRPLTGRKVAGLCLGFAEYTDLDVTLVRLITVLLAIFVFPVPLVAYFIGWIVVPEGPLSNLAPNSASHCVVPNP